MKKSAFIILTYLSLFISITCLGQELVITGKVIDITTDQPIPFVTIRVEKSPIGTIADENGNFTLKLQILNDGQKRLIFSSVGYATKSIAVSIQKAEPIQIVLSPSQVILEGVVIYSNLEKGLTPKKMLKSALRELKNNCPTHNAKATLHHYITENGKYIKYLEANMIIHDPNGYGRSLKSQTSIGDNVKIIQKRESLDLAAEKVKFNNHVNNPLEFLFKNGLKYSFFGKGYEYHIEDTIHQQYETTYVIYARQTKGIFNKSLGISTKNDMKFYLTRNVRDSKIYTLSKFELNQQFDIEKNEYNYHDNSIFVATLKQIGRYSVPDIIENMTIQHTSWVNGEMPDSKIVSYHRLEFDSVSFGKKSATEALTDNHKYNKTFWEDSQLEKSIKQDLSEIIPIGDQFQIQDNDKEKRHLLDSVHYLRWETQIRKLIGHKTIYLVFWNDQRAFFKDMVYEPLLDWLTKREDTDIIFVGTMMNTGLWIGTSSIPGYAFFNHLYLPYSWKKVISQECSDEVPLHVIIDKSGNIICNSAPFSSSYLRSVE